MRGLRREFPTEIEIRDGIFYKILFKSARKMDTETHTVWGFCDPNRREIWIRQGQKPAQRAVTFWHELQHAIEFEWEIDLPHKTIYDLEAPLAHIFKRNAWITWADWKDK